MVGDSEGDGCTMALKSSHLEVTQMTSAPTQLAGTSHMTLQTAKVLGKRRHVVSHKSTHPLAPGHLHIEFTRAVQVQVPHGISIFFHQTAPSSIFLILEKGPPSTLYPGLYASLDFTSSPLL